MDFNDFIGYLNQSIDNLIFWDQQTIDTCSSVQTEQRINTITNIIVAIIALILGIREVSRSRILSYLQEQFTPPNPPTNDISRRPSEDIRLTVTPTSSR